MSASARAGDRGSVRCRAGTVLALALSVGLALCALGAPAASQQYREGMWISKREIMELPTAGRAWRELYETAHEDLPRANIGERGNDCDVLVLAKALVYVRTGEGRLRRDVVMAILNAIGSERNGDTLSLGRNLPGYLIAAELVDVPPLLDARLRAWLPTLLDENLRGMTLRHVHERRPNNWGLHAGGARVVIARYLGDQQELERVAKVFHGWLGDRQFYSGFVYGALDWQADPLLPVGINPRGAQRNGNSLDGVLADDQRRSGPFVWPPPKENYVYEALQGALLQAVVLWRSGYDVWQWGDQALLRAFQWLDQVADFPAEGDDTWQPHVINYFYPQNVRSVIPSRPGKNVGWTDWTLSPFRLR